MKYRLVLVVSLLLALSSFAQTGEEARLLDEIVVNGIAKSTQTLDKQGISFTLLDSSFVVKNNVRSLSDMAKYVPGLEVPQYGSRLTSSMYVRGVGSRINSPSVGVYYENIPLLFKSTQNRHFYNIGKMAVLRGPQGTLYGLNSEGGMVVVDGKDILSLAQKAEKEDSDGVTSLTTAHLGFSNHFGRLAEVGVILPLTDNLALSVDAFYRGTDGYITNHYLNQKADDADEAGVKMKLDWQANNKLRLSLFADFQTDDEHGFAYGETNILGSYKRNIFDTGLNAVYQLGDWRLQSTTSFQYLNDFMKMDQDYTMRNLLQMSQHQNGKAVSEELNLKGNLTDKWLVSTGLYASHQWLTTLAPVYFQKEFTDNIADNIFNGMKKGVAAMQMMGVPVPPMLAQLTSTPVDPFAISMDVPGEFRTPSMNLGVFHESHYDFTKDFSATIGLRYDFNRQDLDYNTAMRTGFSIKMAKIDRTISSVIENSHHHSFNQILPKLSLRYKDWYATVAKGYRAGGYNIQMFSDILQSEFMGSMGNMMGLFQQLMAADVVIPHNEQAYKNIEETISYDPEFSWNYEVGGNSKLTTNNLKLNIRYAAFYSKVRDLQLSVMADTYGFGRMMKNAGKSTSFGGEVSIDGKAGIGALCPASDNRISNPDNRQSAIFWTANYSFTRTKFLDDKRVPFIPAHIVNASVGYELGRYSLELNMNGRGKIFWDEANSLAQPFYAQFGARFMADFGKAKISLWSRNILDYRPTVFAFTNETVGNDKVFSQLGEPFMLGIDLHFSF